MAGYPPPFPPPGSSPGYDPRTQRRRLRDQARDQRAQMRDQARAMRRGSILGPVVLIVAGVIFLLVQTGRLNHATAWEWYGRWWPLLLIAAGVVVLAEWAVDQHLMRDRRRPPYRRSLGGGIFLLILIFVVAGVIADRGISFWPTQSNFIFEGFDRDHNPLDELIGDKHESDQTLDFAFTPGSSLFVVNPGGNVTVTGSSDDGRIHVAVHKQIYATSDGDAASKAQTFAPATSNGASMFDLTMPSLSGARGDLVIAVPATMPITVTANRGDVHVASVKNVVTVTANHGNVELSGIAGSSFVHINNHDCSLTGRSMAGDITVQGRANDLTLADVAGSVNLSGDFFGRTHLEHIKGSVQFHTSRSELKLGRLDGDADISSGEISVDQASGPLVLHTGNRNVSLDRIGGDIAVSTSNGSVGLIAGVPLGNISIEDRNGEVNVTMPAEAGFLVDARTSGGDFSTDFDLASGGPERSRTLTGSVGSGGPPLRIVTSNGDISLHKSNVQLLPAAPPAPPEITLGAPADGRSAAAQQASKR